MSPDLREEVHATGLVEANPLLQRSYICVKVPLVILQELQRSYTCVAVPLVILQEHLITLLVVSRACLLHVLPLSSLSFLLQLYYVTIACKQQHQW